MTKKLFAIVINLLINSFLIDATTLNFSSQNNYISSLSSFWNTRVVPERFLQLGSYFLKRSTSPVVQILYPDIDPEKKIVPFVNFIATVRLLGGWASQGQPLPNEDIV